MNSANATVRNEPVKKKYREMTKEEKREYHRKWRAEHPESVKAAQVRYWAHKAEEEI